jgi:hypothetical protein
MEKIESNNEQGYTNAKSSDCEAEITLMERSESEQHSDHPADNHENETKPKKIMSLVSFLKRPSITDWIIAAATVSILITAYFQWKAVEKSDQTSRLRDRAFVYFANPIIEPFPNKENPVTYRNDIVIINAGNMPARRISVRHSWISFPVAENITDPWPFLNWSDAEIANVLGPKQAGSFQGRGIPVETINDAKMSKIDIFVVMEAKYFDGFETEKVRITQMSRKLRFDKYSYSLGFAGPHNCTDDDCPNQ